MIYIGYDTPDDESWKKWHAEAIDRAEVLRRNFEFGKKPVIDTPFYKKQRALLVERFHRKCAYCETRIDRSPLDVEHYRPKGGVTNAERMIVKILDNNGKEFTHTGYYWLAYDWKNLLPSCQDCNRKRHHEEQNADWGKETCFPVDNDYYVSSPGDDIAIEKPLLINPRFDKPEQHLEFLLQYDDNNRRFCVIKARDRRGEQTIKIFGLNDENLVGPRLFAYERGYTKMQELRLAYDDLNRNPPREHARIRESIDSVKREINATWDGAEPYTAFARLGITRYLANHELNIQIPFPIV
jgi:uncharacterized protein (TIGR02646 family)